MNNRKHSPFLFPMAVTIILATMILIVTYFFQSESNSLYSPTSQPSPTQVAYPTSSNIMGTPTQMMLMPTPMIIMSTGVAPDTASIIPLTHKTEPLPHNGLFVRRNNQYGTKLDIGIKELIDQGVYIDQTNIRFDDFVATSDEGILPSNNNQSIGISYGISPTLLIPAQDNRITHYLEIALRSSNTAQKPASTKSELPVNFIIVIDTSGSMEGEKLETVKASIRELFSQMNDDDVVGIIEFNEGVGTLFKATPKKNISISDFSQKISNLFAGGGTDLNLGLSYGISEISRYGGETSSLNHIYVFTDGNPTSGITDWVQIRQNIANEIRGQNIQISTFAFGSDANARELDALAGLTGGRSAVVLDPKDIDINLESDLNRRDYLTAINIQIKLDIEPDVQILHFYGHDLVDNPATREAVLQSVSAAEEQAQSEYGVQAQPDIVTQEDGIRIFVPDLAVGETYWIILELNVPENKTTIGSATIQYTDTVTRQNVKTEIQLVEINSQLKSDVVVQHALNLWTSEIVYYALDDLYQYDLETARARIENHIETLKLANEYLNSDQIRNDIVTLNKFLSLAKNLGQINNPSDQNIQTMLFHALPQFGDIRDGYNYTNFP